MPCFVAAEVIMPVLLVFAAKVLEMDAAERKTLNRTKMQERQSFGDEADVGAPVFPIAKH
jgi:hypothetical protein